MSVFLRWGVFGILAVAALLYAYNASKRLAENSSPGSAVQAPAPAGEASQEQPVGADVAPAAVDDLAPHCETELRVAERALQARRDQQPLDKLLRTQLIAFETDPARRRRLEKVAMDWYLLEGDEPLPDALRADVISRWRPLSPAP